MIVFLECGHVTIRETTVLKRVRCATCTYGTRFKKPKYRLYRSDGRP